MRLTPRGEYNITPVRMCTYYIYIGHLVTWFFLLYEISRVWFPLSLYIYIHALTHRDWNIDLPIWFHIMIYYYIFSLFQKCLFSYNGKLRAKRVLDNILFVIIKLVRIHHNTTGRVKTI